MSVVLWGSIVAVVFATGLVLVDGGPYGKLGLFYRGTLISIMGWSRCEIYIIIWPLYTSFECGEAYVVFCQLSC